MYHILSIFVPRESRLVNHELNEEIKRFGLSWPTIFPHHFSHKTNGRWKNNMWHARLDIGLCIASVNLNLNSKGFMQPYIYRSCSDLADKPVFIQESEVESGSFFKHFFRPTFSDFFSFFQATLFQSICFSCFFFFFNNHFQPTFGWMPQATSPFSPPGGATFSWEGSDAEASTLGGASFQTSLFINVAILSIKL